MIHPPDPIFPRSTGISFAFDRIEERGRIESNKLHIFFRRCTRTYYEEARPFPAAAAASGAGHAGAGVEGTVTRSGGGGRGGGAGGGGWGCDGGAQGRCAGVGVWFVGIGSDETTGGLAKAKWLFSSAYSDYQILHRIWARRRRQASGRRCARGRRRSRCVVCSCSCEVSWANAIRSKDVGHIVC